MSETEGGRVTGRDAKGTIREIVGRLSLLFEGNNGSIRSPGRGHSLQMDSRYYQGSSGLSAIPKAHKRCFVIDRFDRLESNVLTQKLYVSIY